MTFATVQKKRWFRLPLFFLLWTGLGLAFASQLHMWSGMSWSQALTSSLGDWYVFAVLSLPATALARRFRLEGASWGSMLGAHIFAGVVFSFLYIFARAGLAVVQSRWGAAPLEYFPALAALFNKTFIYNLGVYWMIVAVTHAFGYYEKFHANELRSRDLEARLAQAKLKALQMQLNPHFLFNTLHTISALLYKDIDEAERMIAKLSQLLRLALDNTDTHEVPLRQELDFLGRYLEIEQTRFGERLKVEMEIAPAMLDKQVPNLVLQPLVENAIRHGIEPHSRPGKITLRAFAHARQMELQVQDNGAGLPKDGACDEGIGLSNTRARLEQLYGLEQTFELQNLPSGGLLARVVIPLRDGQDAAQIAA
jgi:two-component system LytT family sensor kinase